MDSIRLDHILILLGISALLGLLLRRVRLPPMLAYLVTGVLVGPHALGWMPSLPETRALAEFGLVFFLFTLGLEFSWPKLVAMRRLVLGLGGAQVGVCALLFGLAAWLAGVSANGAVMLGGALAFSSTAIVMKLLAEQLEQHSRHGRAAFGVLLMQDLAVVPFLIILPGLAGDGRLLLPAAGFAIVKSLLVLAAILMIGRWLLRPLFHAMARMRSRETFALTVLLVTLSCAWATESAGLSASLGAFLAGLMIAETEFRHQAEGDILPFRDVLMGLFFVTVGMLLEPAVLYDLWPIVLAVLAASLAVKVLVVLAIGRLFSLETGVALRTGLVLAAGGEFGFALLVSSGQAGLLGGETLQVVLAVNVLGMLLAPLIVHFNGRIARRMVRGYRERHEVDLDQIRTEAGRKGGHVILCGYGRSGQNLAWLLAREHIPTLALDLDPVRVRNARDAGEAVVYGDVTRRDVLLAAGLAEARALAVSFIDTPATLKLLRVLRDLRPDLPVIVRTKDDQHLDDLKTAGATEVVPEGLEGSLMIGSHLLVILGVPVSRIVRRIQDVRRDRYRMLRGFFHGATGVDESEDAYRERLSPVTLLPEAHAIGRELRELPLAEMGVTLASLRRGGKNHAEPVAGIRLEAGDVLVLSGSSAALAQAEKILLEG